MLGKIETTELPNGCRVVTSAMPGVDSVSLCFDAGSGGRFERPAEGGFSHFLEHMLFKGSARRPTTRALSRPLERVGGQFNAYTSAEHTCFHATVPADAVSLAADVIGDMFAHPLFDADEIGRERMVVLEEIKMYHDDPRRSAMTVLNHALGGGLTSRLFMSVRERHGLAYSISSGHQSFRDAGAFQVYAGLDAARAAKALALVARELRAVAEKGLGRRELADAKSALSGMQRLGGETSQSQMSWILSRLRWFGRVETPDEVVARIRAVTADQVQALARDLFRPENLSLALVMPRGGTDGPDTLLAALRD